ncbi:MAG: FAD-binding protein, partial [Chloroflexota bacterium]
MSLVDAIVVGRGPAGLAAAVQLARLGRSVTIVDDDAGRSLWAQVTRNYLGFPGGVPAADLRLLGQRQATDYGAKLTGGRVVDARPRPDGTFALRVRPARAVDAAASGGEALDGR